MKRSLLIALLACFALSVSAREFEAGEKLYFNAKPSSATWWKDGTAAHTIKLWGRLVDGSAEYWIEAQWYGSDNCYLEIPDDANATGRSWSKLILYRCAYDNRGDVINHTGEIDIDNAPSDKNYIQNFYYGTYKEEANWWNLTFAPIEAPTGESVDGVKKEVLNVCTSSAGDPLSLQPILAGNPLMYDYNHSAAHAWFKWNGSAWVALDGQSTGFYSGSNAWGYEGGTQLKETIGAAGSSTLYFLWTEKPSRRRFLEVDVTEDCSATLEITDFGVVISNLDVDNSTYTLDGIVAFNDEAVLSSPPTQLRISVTDTKGEHHVDYVHNSPDPITTPFVFHLPGLYADGATGLVAKAEFVGTGYSKLSDPYTAPDASDVEIVPLEQAYGETTTFTAPGGENGFKWNDGLTSTTRTVPAYDYDETVKYTYYDYEKLPAKSGDLIKNGDFSDASFDYGTPYYKLDVKGSNISEYNYWGKDVTSSSDFYDTHKDGGQSISGGMSIIKDANKFWKRYTKKISPKKETHYALFDADNSGSKKAWHIVTNATTQPDLKLAKGTNYLFSFWVANINNYGEMNNAAKLQFAIRYKQGGSWSAEELLGNPIDLNNFQDNIWHQNSYVYTSPADANDVEIMVRDLNASANPGGNDFALDDIRFSPIVAVTPAAKSIKRYVVTIFEASTVVEKPVINIEDPACGSTKYNMTVTVNYSTLNSKITPIKFELIDDVYGVIYKDEDFDPVANPNSITIPLSSLAADNKIHNLTAKITRINGAGKDKGGQNSNKYTAPGVPALSVTPPDVPTPGCNVVTYDLDVTTTFAYQKGTQLLFYWDGILHSEATQDITYGASTSTTVTLTNLPYDGENHTLEVKTDNTTLDCTDSKTVHSPHNPIINSITQSLEPDYVCGEDQYHVSLTVNYTNALGRKICVKDGTEVLKSALANTSAGTKTTTIKDLNFDFDTNHNLKVYFEGHETCAEEVVVKSPAKPKVTAEYSVINKDCSKTTYDLEVTVHYINQNGTPHVDVDGKAAETYSPDVIEKNQPEERLLVAVVKNLPADGGTAHKLNVSFNESHGCSLDPIILTGIPHQPVINSITQSGPAYVCGEYQYHVTLKVNYTNALGNQICVKEGTDVIASVAAYTGDANKEADILLDFDFDTNHNLKVYFKGHEECAEDVVVKSPVKPALSATSKVVNTACNKTTYDLEVTVKYTNQNGKLHVDVDGKAAKEPKPEDITENSTDELTYVAVVKDLPADEGTAHTLNVSFNGDHGCHLAPIILTGIPHRPVINSITQSGPAYVCGENQYHDTLKVTYTNALGKKICVKEGTEVIKSVKAKTSADKDSTIIPLDLDFGADHNLKVYFEGHEECAEELTIVSPAKPALTVTPNVINPNCDVTTYSLRLKLNYTNQRGATILANVDGGTDKTKANAYVSVMEPKEDSIQIDGLLADGKLHKFNLRFDDDDCEALNVAFNAPFGPKISTVTATVQDYACGDDKYKVKVEAAFENGQGHNLIIEDWKGAKTTITPQESNKAWHEFEYAWETPATHEYKVYFVGAETCDNHKASFTSPAEPKLTVKPTVINPDCDVTTYSLRLDLTYTNQRGNNILANVDGGANVTKANSHKSEATSEEEFVLIENLPADGKEHTFNLRFDDSDDCDTLNVKFTAPYSPQIGTVKATVQDYACGDKKYQVKVEVPFSNGQGHKLIIEDWKGAKKTITTQATDEKKEYTFEYAWETPATHEFKAYFVGAETCDNHKASFTSPAEPKLTVKPTVINPDCDVTKYTLRLDLTYTNQRGNNILANVDGGANVTKVNSHKSQATSEEEFVLIENLPADGKEHTFNLRFDDSDDCDTLNGKFTAPYSPQIGTVKATVQDYACGDKKYQVKVEVPFSNGQGHNLVIEDWKGAKTTITPQESNKAWHEFEYAWETPATHEFKAYFVGAEGCNNHKASFKSPAEPKLTVTPTVVNPDCDVTTYSLRLDLKYTNQRGNTILANVDGGTDVVKANAHKSEAAEAEEFILIENLPADGKEHTFNLRFDDSDDCDTLNGKFTAPYSPQIGTVKATVQDYACGDRKYQVKVEVPFSNGQGHNLVIEDWKGAKKTITPQESNKAWHEFEYAWETPATHAYKIYFVGAEGCDNHKSSFTSPAEPKLTVKPTVINPDCDVTTYSLRLDLKYTNQRGNTILANVDGGTDVVKANAHKSEATEAEEFILIENLPADGKTHKFNLRFDNTSDCDALGVDFTAPYGPKIGTAKATVQPYACGDDKYKVKVEAAFENGQGHNLIIEDWKGSKKSITTETTDTKAEYTFEYAWEAPATHAYKIYFAGAEGCDNHKASFTSPAEPKLTVKPTVVNPDCDVTKYTLRLDLTYTNQRGNNILANVDGGTDVVKANAHKSEAAEAEEFILIENLPADGKTHKFNLRFDNTSDCDALDVDFTAPYGPKIGTAKATVQPYACGDDKYKVKVEAAFENGQGHNLIIEDWKGNKKSITTASTDTKAEQTFSYDWEAPTSHAYKVYFEGAEDCQKTPSFDVPLWHHIETVTVVSDATVPCNDPSFNAVVTVQASYDITGQNLVFSYDDNGAKDTVITATGQTTVATIPLHTIEGPDQAITVAFKDAPTCGKQSDLFTPAKRDGCRKDEATICESDTYPWIDGNTYPLVPFIGTDTFTRGYDSLILTVKALPKITLQSVNLPCEDEISIALPYSLDKGEPDTWSLTVDGVAQPITAVTATDILIPSLTPGPHRAEVTVGVAGITCDTTATVNFTVAIAQQVYSKWTDVLFVNNKGGLYTAYQWYADNKLMDGETQQRLYDPKGLSGNNVIYYCELTTTAGKTLYTCPQKFEDTPRSADQKTGEDKVQSTMIYDNMGRIISGTPKDGMYIIVEKLESGDVRVRKIAVYE